MTTTPPGWYDDGRGALRWWDGRQWTEHVQIPDPEPPTPGGEIVPPAPTRESAAEGADGWPETPADPALGVPGVLSADLPPGQAPGGAFISATDGRKSRLWILWVVLGVVLLGVVIAAAVLIPILIGAFGRIASSEGASPIPGSSPTSSVEVEVEGVVPTPSAPAEADEQAAVAAVLLYDEAWADADCDKYFTATTESFRVMMQMADCAAFEEEAWYFGESTDQYEVEILEVAAHGDLITVSTSETYLLLVDDQGAPLTGEPVEDLFQYILASSDDGWEIDDVTTP